MPPTTTYPGVYVEEVPAAVPAVAGADTATAVFVGRAPRGPLAGGEGPRWVQGLAEFEAGFGAVAADWPLGLAVRDFFLQGGKRAWVLRLHADPQAGAASAMGAPLSVADYMGDAPAGTGLHALRRTGGFNLLCIPPDTPGGDTAPQVWQAGLAHCVQHCAMLLVDAPGAWETASGLPDAAALAALGLTHPASRNAALYFPRVVEAGVAHAEARVPCGAVAGIYARTDASRGVWKAPAGLHADLRGLVPARRIDDHQQAVLNPLGINCLRLFPQAAVLWGARTLAGADVRSDEFKYVPVRRLALHIEESLQRGLGWAVFEPNGEPLWARLRGAVDAFLHGLFREGALAGSVPRDAYFVQCDLSTNNVADIAAGRCRLQVGFAPLRPAEFVILQLLLRTAPPVV